MRLSCNVKNKERAIDRDAKNMKLRSKWISRVFSVKVLRVDLFRPAFVCAQAREAVIHQGKTVPPRRRLLLLRQRRRYRRR